MYIIFQRVYKRTLMFLSGRTSGRATLNAVERVLLVAAERNANGSVLGRLLRRADAGAGRARRDGVRRAAVVGKEPLRERFCTRRWSCRPVRVV